MGGLHTLDESHAYAHFRRGRVFHILGHVKLATAAIDWTESLWYEDNLTADLGDWNDTANTSVRELKNGSYARNCVPFIDDSGDTKYLKVAFVGDHHHPQDDFIQMGSLGTRVEVNGGGNPDICAVTDTGIALDSNGDLTDGDHALQLLRDHDLLTWAYSEDGTEGCNSLPGLNGGNTSVGFLIEAGNDYPTVFHPLPSVGPAVLSGVHPLNTCMEAKAGDGLKAKLIYIHRRVG